MNKKGVTPVIATVLLLTIIAASIIVIYAYVSGATVLPDTDQQVGKMIEKLKTVEVRAYADGQFYVFIMNTGNVDSVIDTFYVKDFAQNTIYVKSVNSPIAVGETQEFPFDPYLVGQSPWSWYEIMGVTDRGNVVRANLYGFFTGAYELGEGPSEYENDTAYYVYNVTTNGVPTAPSNLPNLTAIDGNYFGYPASGLNNTVVSYPSGAFDLDIVVDHYVNHGEDITKLQDFGASTVLHFNVHPQGGDYFLSSIFNGTTSNQKYPELVVTFVFDLQGSAYTDLNVSMQFYDYSSHQYVTSGNGYYQCDGPSIPMANSTAPSGFKNVTFTVNAAGLLSDNGEWNIMLNMTNSNNANLRLDYFSVAEKVEYTHAFETIFYYKANNLVDENNVTSILFSTTGIFPLSAASYWFGVYNFDTQGWNYLGQFQGNPNLQTCIFEITDQCASYIQNSTNSTMAKILPVQDLPATENIYIEQTRMIIRQVGWH